ncbi:hypothetical protein NQ314_003728 [Rhamnusium bicolor]|uniref:Poly [ADP-ribose] polymerase n=1 Tax=Rhamnusium bicolor TaxID=1586634 RepID=A0AAV8ZMZ0_9CUCU|nr:hypothetical protein NQ314_003728 [Rhamnusium bicolor]
MSRIFVKQIEKVFNPYLRMQYKLMKIEYKKRYGHVYEKTLFHGTQKDNIDSICTNNLNWRLTSKHKFGEGVSFSPISNYATHYSDETYDKNNDCCKCSHK